MNHLLAQQLQLPGSVTIQGVQNLHFTTLGSVISAAVPFVFLGGGIGLLFMLIASGFDFLTSAGDSKKMETGKQRFTYAIVGFIVIFVAYWGVQAAARIFGLTEVESIFK